MTSILAWYVASVVVCWLPMSFDLSNNWETLLLDALHVRVGVVVIYFLISLLPFINMVAGLYIALDLFRSP